MISTTLIKGYEQHHKIYCSSSKLSKIFRVSRNINEEWNIIEGFDIGLIRFNVVTSEVNFYTFKKPAHIVPINFTQNTYYYGTLNWNGSMATVSIYKIHYDNSNITEDKIYSLELKDNIYNDLENSNLWGIELYILSERYICMAIPHSNKQGKLLSRFTQFILVDIYKKNSYTLPELIGEEDTIFRLDTLQAFDIDDQKFILLSTGRILSGEKEELWKKNNSDVHVMLQNVVIMKLDEFINLVKSKTPISSSYIVDTAICESGIVNISVCDNLVILHKHIFRNKTSECLFINVLTKEKKTLNLNDLYTRIIAVDGKMVGFSQHDSNIGIYNIKTGLLEFSLNDTGNLIQIGSQETYIVSKLEGERLYVDSIGSQGTTNLLDIKISSDLYLLVYNEQSNGIVCIL